MPLKCKVKTILISFFLKKSLTKASKNILKLNISVIKKASVCFKRNKYEYLSLYSSVLAYLKTVKFPFNLLLLFIFKIFKNSPSEGKSRLNALLIITHS